VCATAGDLLTFAELHLRDGRAADGAAILAPGVAALMRRRHLETPPLSRPSARGLGWGIFDQRGAELAGHDGETLGQIASLRLLPAEELAFVVLTNAIPDGDEIARALGEAVLEPWGIRPPEIDVPAAAARTGAAFDPRPYVGRYRNLDATFHVSAADHGLSVTIHTTAEGLDDDTEVTRLTPLGDGAFVDADVARPTRAVRFDDPGPDGRFQSYFAGRVAWRVTDAAA